MAIRKYGYRRKRLLRRPRRVVRRANVRRRRVMRSVPKPEVKTAIFQSSTTAFNQSISSSDPMPLIPSISQGTTSTNRIGDKIRVRSLNVRGVITMDNGAYSSIENCRIGVRVMILRAKRYADFNILSANFSADSLKLLEGTTNGWLGYLYDFTTPINRDFFSVLMDKRFYLSRSHIASVGGISTQLDKSYAFFSKNLKYHSNRILQYDSNTNGATGPVNYPYIMLLGYVKLDGTGPDGGTTTNVELQYTTTLKFVDN